MSIQAVCPHCRHSHEVPEQFLGRKATCSSCRQLFVIESGVGSAPAAAPKSAAVAAKSDSAEKPGKVPNPLRTRERVALCPSLRTKEEVQRFRAMLLKPLLNEPMETIPLPTNYKIGLTVLAIVLVILFCIYLGMIFGLFAFLYYYLQWCYTDFTTSASTADSRNAVLAIVLYSAVPIGGGAVIYVLIKPLLFGWWSKETRFEISREKEPLLHDFVDHLCSYIGSPAPNRIFVDCEVNATAGLSKGVWGAIFGGNDSDLTIGLPLVAGMKTSEFTGVLAHEFGHFTQAGARRVNYIVRMILFWFSFIYGYRDRMDSWLLAGTRSGFHLIMIFCGIILAFIWLARRVIWVFMLLGNLCAGYLSREMEYDADSFEYRLVGDKYFAQGMKKILMLAFANQKTISDIQYMIQEERLVDNYPLLIAANVEIHAEDLSEYAEKHVQEGKTSVFDTHPSDKDRIAAAERSGEKGVLHCDLPASLLFRNFLGLCREVTLEFYRNELELTWNPDALKNAADIVVQLQREGSAHKAMIEFFRRSFIQTRILSFRHLQPHSDVRYSAQRIRLAREEQLKCSEHARKHIEDYDKADTDMVIALYAKEIARLGGKPNIKGVGFKINSARQGDAAIAKIQLELARAHAALEHRDMAIAERLFRAREVLTHQEMQNRIEDGPALHRRMEQLFAILYRMGNYRGEIEQERRAFSVTSAFLSALQGCDDQIVAGKLLQTINVELDRFKSLLGRCRKEFYQFPYPFTHGNKDTTVGSFLVPVWNENQISEQECFDGMGTLLERFFTTNTLILGEVAAIALTVEDGLRLPRLPLPPKEEESEEEKKKK